MGWATHYIARLQASETVTFRPTGSSMRGRIEPGQRCTVEPVADASQLSVDDVVLCRVGADEYLHLIRRIEGDRFLIGNNRGCDNGWIDASQVFGRCVRVES